MSGFADRRLLAGLEVGDEHAFVGVLHAYHPGLVRLAMTYVPEREAAEQLVRETWLEVIDAARQPDGHRSLKAWIFEILVDRASAGVGVAAGADSRPYEGNEVARRSVDADRFWPAGNRSAGWWRSPPRSWNELPAERLSSASVRARASDAISSLPPLERRVLLLRDVEGFDAATTRGLLGLSQEEQRRLLHSGRSRIRAALEQHFETADLVPSGRDTGQFEVGSTSS